MADVKAAKLAAARKKLQEHQHKKNTTSVSSMGSGAEIISNHSNEPQREVFVSQVQQNNSSLPYQSVDFNENESNNVNNPMEPFEVSHANDEAVRHEEWSWQEHGVSQDETQQRELHNHVQNHVKAAEILVMEKRNLESKIHSLEEFVRILKGKHTETLAGLNVAKQNSFKLETELKDAKAYIKSLSSELEQKTNEIESFRLRENNVLESKGELEEKLEMTVTALTAKTTENASLQNQLVMLKRDLDITQLHLQQLTNGKPISENDATLDPIALLERNNLLQNQVTRLEQDLKCAQNDREQLMSHYQIYIQQLNDQLESTMAQNQHYKLENEKLADRESSLVDQISEMENRIQALQHHISILKSQEPTADRNESANELSELTLQLEASKAQNHLLEENYKNVKKLLSESEEKVIQLSESVQTLQIEQPDITKLNAANESDKVAAQRATAQNTKLKEELHGLQDAFVAMSNDKLELTEKLQAEKFLNRELTIKLSECEEILKEVQNKLMAKDEEMIRLQTSCSKLEKESLQHSQELDRLRHYEVTQSTDEMLQMELDSAQQTISNLNREIAALRSSADHSPQHCHDSDHIADHLTPGQNSNNDSDKNTPINIITKPSSNVNLNAIPTEEAMMKLQQRFMKTMSDVAELSDEKQKLEHIVLQLQGETETICEYIALYQQQRGVLKQREEERTAQMKYLAAERERMQGQLEELRRMVTGAEGAGDPAPPFHRHKVEQIVNLLSDIKQSHLIDPNKQCTGSENFNPCPWCSGKLINV